MSGDDEHSASATLRPILTATLRLRGHDAHSAAATTRLILGTRGLALSEAAKELLRFGAELAAESPFKCLSGFGPERA